MMADAASGFPQPNPTMTSRTPRDMASVESSLFFFNDTATTEIYTLSLHDALPISSSVDLGEVHMLPAPFGYHRPSSLDEAVQLLSSLDEAKVLAGGQSLIPLLKFRFAAPAHLIDVNRVPGLDGIREDGGSLRIGALVRHNQMAESNLISARYPTLAAAAPQIADPIVRNLGTVGGSLAHADPAGDWGAVMLAVGGSVVARSARGEREIPIADFLQDIFTTALSSDEILTEVRVPAPGPRTGGAYLKLERKVGDFATVAAAVHVSMEDGP